MLNWKRKSGVANIADPTEWIRWTGERGNLRVELSASWGVTLDIFYKGHHLLFASEVVNKFWYGVAAAKFNKLEDAYEDKFHAQYGDEYGDFYGRNY